MEDGASQHIYFTISHIHLCHTFTLSPHQLCLLHPRLALASSLRQDRR